MENIQKNSLLGQMHLKESRLIHERCYTMRHASGLPIYVVPKKMSTSYAVLGTRYGSIDNCFRLAGEDTFTRVPDGIAHFLEHKMFENENGEDTFARFARTGANANAYTSFDLTAYLFSCTENFVPSLEILLDFVTQPYFTPETVLKEQGIIGQELRMYEDDPGQTVFYNMLKAMYASHPVRINIGGTVESISGITADILYRCYRTFYHLSNMGLFVSGDVALEEVLEAADRVLPSKAEAPLEIIRGYPEEAASVKEETVTASAQVARPLVCIGVKDTEISTDPQTRMKKALTASIVNDMLFGRTSDLYEQLYEGGLINRKFGGSFAHNKSFSFLELSAETDQPLEVYRRVKECALEAAAKPISEETFERCRRVLYSGLVMMFENTEDIANSYMEYVFDGRDLLDAVDTVPTLTAEDAQRVMQSLFRPECFAVSVVEPLK